MQRLGGRVLAALLAVLLVTGCLPIGGKGGQGGGAKPPPYRSGTAAALAKRLTGGKGMADALAATREALALGGIVTRDGERIIMQATAPAAAVRAIPQEVAVLALEQRERASAGRLTLADLGDRLKGLGWPFRSGSTPGEQLRELIAAWVQDAVRKPDSPLSFTPLFLRETALSQRPSIDLAGVAYAPEDLRLTLLELELFAAHFDRLGRPKAQSGEGGAPGWLVATASAAEPCSAAKEWLGSPLGDGEVIVDVSQILASEGVGEGLKAALQRAGLTEAGAERFGKALGALGIAARLWKLVSLYSQAQVTVTVESSNPVHKPLASEARLLAGFRARAGVSDEDWKAYRESVTSSETMGALRDCFGSLGLPVIPDLGDMGREAKNWTVEWRLPAGSPEHAYISLDTNTFYLPGQLEMKLEADGDHSASALLVVDITPEKGKAHSGPEKKATVVAEAALETAAPPSLGTWTNALKGGLGDILALADALVELGAGWIAEMLPPKAYAPLTVTYHEGGGGAWTGTITYSKTRESDKTETGKDPWGKYANSRRTVESYSRTATVRIGGSDLVSAAGPEQVITLRGEATVTAREEKRHDNWRQDNGCKGESVATEHEQSHSLMEAGGAGPAEGDLIIANNGTYSIVVGDLPQASGSRETQFRHWWENKPCVEDNKQNQYGDPVTGLSVGTIAIDGKLDPAKPGVIEGQYEKSDSLGYKLSITWRLQQQR